MEDAERRRKLEAARIKFAQYQQRKAKSDCSDSTKKKKKRKSQAVHQDDLPEEEHSLVEQDGVMLEHKEGDVSNNSEHIQTELEVCHLRIIELEEQLDHKEVTLEQLITEMEELQNQQATLHASEEMQQELEIAVQERNDIIGQLTDNLQQAIRNRDEVQQEALELTDQIQSLQHQLQQASDILKNKSPGLDELLQAQQQISLFQQSHKDQCDLMETLEQKAHELELQLEYSEQNAKDKENCLIQIVEQHKITENTVQQLNQWIEEREEVIKELREKQNNKDSITTQLHHSLSLWHQEVTELNNESANKQSQQQSPEEIGQHVNSVEDMQKQFGQKDTLWYVEQLRIDLEAMQRQEIAHIKQELCEQAKQEVDELNIKHKAELDFLQRQIQSCTDGDQIKNLNKLIIDLSEKLQESCFEKEGLQQKLQNMMVSPQEKSDICEIDRRLVQDLEEQVKMYKSEKEHLNACLAEEKEVIRELQIQHEHEITNYSIKLEMMEREKNDVLSRLAESQEAELEQLKTKMLFSHEAELTKLQEDLEMQYSVRTEALRKEMEDLERNLHNESHRNDISQKSEAMDQEKFILTEKCAELTKELQQRGLELEKIHVEAKMSASQTEEAEQKWEAALEQLSSLRLELEKESAERLRYEEQLKDMVHESKRNELTMQPPTTAAEKGRKEKEGDLETVKEMVKDLKEENHLLLVQLREQEQLVKEVQEQKIAADSVTSEVQALFGRQLASLQNQRDQLQNQLDAQKVKGQTMAELLGQKSMQEDTLCKELEETEAKWRENEERVKQLTDEKMKLETKVLSHANDFLRIEEMLGQIKAENDCLKKDKGDLIANVQDLECKMHSEVLAVGTELKGKVAELQKLKAVMENQEALHLQQTSALKLEISDQRKAQHELEQSHSEKMQVILRQQEERLTGAVEEARKEVTVQYEEELNKMEELYLSDIMNLKTEHQRELDELNAEMKKKVLDLQQKQEDERRKQIGLIKQVHEREHDREMSTLINKHKEEVEQQRAKLTQEQQALFDDIRFHMDTAREEELCQARLQMQTEHSLELESLRLSLNNMHRAQLELVQSNLQREKEEALTELQEVLNDKRRQEVAVLQNRQQFELECMREQNQQQMDQSLQKHQQEMEDLRKALEEEMTVLKARIVAEESEKLQNKQKEWEEETKQCIEIQKQTLSTGHQTELQEWTRKVEKLQSELEAAHNEAVACQEDECRNLESLCQLNLTKLQEQIQKDYEQKQEELIRAFDEKEKEHHAEMVKLQTTYDEFKLRSDQELEHLWSQLESTKASHEELSEFKEHLLACTSRVEDVEILRQEFAEQRELIQKQHVCELEQLENYFEEKLKEMKEKNDEEVAQLEQRLQEDTKLPLGLESDLSLNQTTEPSLSLLSFTDLTEKNYFQHRIQIVEELAQRLEQYKEELKMLQMQLEEKNKQEMAASLMHKEKLEMIEKELSERHLAEIEKLKMKHHQELEQLQDQLSEEHVKEITRLRLQCAQQTAREVEVQVSERLHHVEEEERAQKLAMVESERKRNACLQEIECLKRDHAMAIMQLTEQHEERILEMKNKAQLLEETSHKLEASREAVVAKMQECMVEKERELKTLREELQANTEKKLSALREELTKEFEEEKRAWKQEFDQKSAEMNQIREEQSATISKLEIQLKEEKSYLLQLQDSLANEQLPEIVVIRQKIQVQFDAELAMAKSLMAEELEKLHISVQEQSALKLLEAQNRFMEEHRQMMDKFMSEQEILLQELKVRHAEELETQNEHLIENHQSQIEDLKAEMCTKHQSELEALENTQLAALESLRLKHEAELEDVACKYKSEIQRLKEDLEICRDELERFNREGADKRLKEINHLKAEQEAELINVQERVQKELAAIHMEKFKAMAAELEEIHKGDLEAAISNQKTLLEQEHQKRLDLIRDEVLHLEGQHKQALEELQILQSAELEKQKEEYERKLGEELEKIEMHSQKEQVHACKTEIKIMQLELQSKFEKERSQQLQQFQEEFELLKSQSEFLITQQIKQLKDEFEVEKSNALEELKEVFSQEQEKTKQLHQEEKKQMTAKLQQQTELIKQLQREVQDKSSELDTLLQRRDRENEEGGNLVAMLRSDLERVTNERKNLERSHERVLKLFSEVVRVTFSSEDMISKHIEQCLDREQTGNAPDPGNNQSLLGTRGRPPWIKSKALLENEKGDLNTSQENATVTEDSSLWSALTDERLELSQWLSESMFTGPDVGLENEELILSMCERLQAAVEKLLELVTISTRQLMQNHGIHEHDGEGFMAQNLDTVEIIGKQHQKLIEHLSSESEAKDKLALELHKAEGLIDGYATEKAVLEEALQKKEESEKHLALQVDLLNKQLNELNQENLHLCEERDLLLCQKQVMAGNEVERGLLEETERLTKEKLDIQCQADKDRADLLSRTKRMEVELEEETNRNVELADNWHLEVADLQQQIQALEKQLKNYRQFMDEQAAEREHERDEFQQEIENLEKQLKQGLKSQGVGDLGMPKTDYLSLQMETMEEQIRSKTNDYSELLLTKQCLEQDLEEQSEEIAKLEAQIKELEEAALLHTDAEKRISKLEQEIQKMRRREEELSQDKESLQQQQYSNLMQISALQSKLDEARHRVPAEGLTDQTLKEQLQNERQTLQTKEDEIQMLEEQLDQFRENLMNKNDEMFQLNMQLEIQTKQSAMTINQLQEENIRVKEDVASLHMRLGLDADNGRVPGLQLPHALLQEKNQEIDELKEQIFKLQKEMENTSDNKAFEEKNSEIEELKTQIEQLTVDQERLRQTKEEEIEHLIEVIEKLQQELSLLGPNRHEFSDSQEDLDIFSLEKESGLNVASSRGLNDNLLQELAFKAIDSRGAGDFKQDLYLHSAELRKQMTIMTKEHSEQLLDKNEVQFQGRLELLQTNLQSLQEINQRQQQNLESLQLQRNTLQEDNSLLKTRISQRNADVSLLSSHVKELEDAQNEKEKLLQMIEKQRQVELEEMGLLSTRIVELEQALADKTAQFHTCNDELQTLRSDFLEHDGLLQTLKQEGVNLQVEVERLQGQLAKQEAQNEELKDHVKQLKKEQQSVGTTLTVAEIKVKDDLMEKLKQMQSALQQKELLIAQLNVEHERLQADLSAVKEELSSSEERVDKLLEAEQVKVRTIADLEIHTRNLKTQVNQLQEALLQQEEELTNQAKEVKDLKEKCQRQELKLQQQSNAETNGSQTTPSVCKEASQTLGQGGHQPLAYSHTINQSLLSSPELMRKFEESLDWMNGLHTSRISEISGLQSTDVELMQSRSSGLEKDTDGECQSNPSAKARRHGRSPSPTDHAHSLSESSDAGKAQRDVQLELTATAMQEDKASTVSIPDSISEGCGSCTSLDLGAKLNQELETTERLDNSFVEYLQRRGIALIDVDGHTREHNLPAEEEPSPQLQALLNQVHEEGCRVLALTERPSLCRGSQLVSVSSKTMEEWQHEKEGLLDTIQLLKDLLLKALNKFDEDSTSIIDWRRDLLLAVQAVLNQEQKSFLAELHSYIQNRSTEESTLFEKFERMLKEQEKQQQSALEDLLSVDRSSLLSEVQDLRSQLRIAHLQHQEKLQQLQDTLTGAEEQAKKQERPLRRQVELLEYKLQQEQIIANDLQTSLRAEQDRSAELRQHLQTEQATVSELKSDLTEVTVELEASLQTRHELQQNLQKLRGELNAKENELLTAAKAYDQERQKVQQLQNLVEKEQFHHREHKEQERLAHLELQKALEEQRAHNHQLSATFEEERAKNKNSHKDIEAKLLNSESLLLQEHRKLAEMQELLKMEKSHLTELSKSLDRERARSEQLYQFVNTRRDDTVTQERAFIKELQSQLEEERKRTVELATMIEKTQQQAISAKRNLEDEIQLSRQENQKERDVSSKLRLMLESVQSQVQELNRLLESERQHSLRLQTERERLQANILAVKEKERTKDDRRDRERRQERQELADHEKEQEMLKDRMHELELQHQRDQQRIRELQQVLADLEEQECKLASRKRQRGETESSAMKCSMNAATCNAEGRAPNVQQRLENMRQQFLQLTVRLKELLHRTEQRGQDGHIKTEDIRDLLQTLIELNYESQQFPSGTQEKPVDSANSLLNVERLNWMKERSQLQNALKEAESELARVMAEIENRPLQQDLVDHSSLKMQRLYAKYHRAECFRKALVFQKKYLLLLLGGFQQCEQATLCLIARMGVYPSPTDRLSRPLTKFRSIIRVVIAIFRLKFFVKKWQKATRRGLYPAPAVNGIGGGQAPTIKTEVLRQQHSPSTHVSNSPPTRESVSAQRLNNTSHHSPKSPYRLQRSYFSLEGAQDQSGLSSNQDPERSLTEYIQRLEAIQQRLGGTSPGLPQRKSSMK